jgi:hypothetical protein
MKGVEQFSRTRETLEGEYLKSLAEFGLHSLAEYTLGQHVIELVSGGERIEDPSLHTEVAGLQFENPLMVINQLYEVGRTLGIRRSDFQHR